MAKKSLVEMIVAVGGRAGISGVLGAAVGVQPDQSVSWANQGVGIGVPYAVAIAFPTAWDGKIAHAGQRIGDVSLGILAASYAKEKLLK